MILSFNKENIEKRNFKEKILNGTKIHTIREDKHNRWKPGMSIQFYAMNPRNGGKKFAEGIVTAVVPVHISPDYEISIIYTKLPRGGSLIRSLSVEALAKNDGFESWEEMKEFFPEFFEGKIIYWGLK